MSNTKGTISYIWPIVRQYQWQFYGLFILYLFRVGLASIVVPLFYKRIIDLISNERVDTTLVTHVLFHSILLIALTLFLAWFFGRVTQHVAVKFQSKVINDLQNFSFKKLHGHSYTFFANHFSGALVNKSRKFVRAFETMHDIIMDNFWTSFVLLFAVFVVFFIEAKVISFIFLSMSIAYIFVLFLMSKKKMKYDIAEAAADSRSTAYLADTITNAIAVKSSSAFKREVESFKNVTYDEAVLRLRAWMFSNKLNAVQSGISSAITVVALVVAGYLWLSGKISAGLFVLIQSYFVTIGGQFWDLGRATTRFSKSLSDMKEMVDIFREIPDVVDVPSPEKSKIKAGVIEMKNVDFQYINGTKVFKEFNLRIQSGEKVGLVGHSGSGKTTITKLIMRFVNITRGEILIDGQDISKITQDDLHANISYISQEPILFHRSIRDNIAYSFPEASEEQVKKATQSAHADEFISRFERGYETFVGERGIKLSGGERQRVAIARAMLKPTPILILDEATSSLDSISESYIQDSFNELMKNKTTIVIAHRLSTIQKMDRIIVLDKGKIVEEGTHKELLTKGGVYADLWEHQTGGFLQ